MKSIFKISFLFFLIIGMIWGISSEELSLPVIKNSNGAIYHGPSGHDKVSMAINVDWGGEYIPGILNCLDEKNIKVTFFLTGNWIEKNPDLLKEIVRRGHEIGNHGYRHYHLKNMAREDIIKLIKMNEELILNLTRVKTNLFAPPYGEVDKRITEAASSIGYETIMWSADTIDWQKPAPEIIVQRAVNKIGDGGIILMHPTANTLTALPEIISNITKKGYKFVIISNLINRGD